MRTVLCSPFASLDFLLLFELVFLMRILITEPIPIRAAHQTSDDWRNAGPAWEGVRSYKRVSEAQVCPVAEQ